MAPLSSGSCTPLPIVMTTAPTNSHGHFCFRQTSAPATTRNAATTSTISGGPVAGSALP